MLLHGVTTLDVSCMTLDKFVENIGLPGSVTTATWKTYIHLITLATSNKVKIVICLPECLWLPGSPALVAIIVSKPYPGRHITIVVLVDG